VFTPKGELKTLPTGATALDFAFDIHTEIGAHCIGAKVNQRLVPLNHPLKNGDQVEILTSDKQKPHEDWLRFVVSSKARARIKECLKEDKRSAALDGREIVERKLKQMKLQPTPEIINQLRAFFDCKTSLEFFYKVGLNQIDPKDIKRFREFRDVRLQLKKPEIQDATTFEQEIRKVKSPEQDYLLIGEDMNVVDYKLSRCCSPIPGDDVFGFVTVNEGIKIHRVTCPNAVELLSNYGYRVVKAKWTSRQKIAFLAGLKIDGTDRVGLINDITRVISEELHVNIQSVSIETEDGIFEGTIRLYVNDTRHLDLLIKKLEKVEGVNKAFRFN
jgi:guanosine-3',5'-bis(diphosphate) 3'-pyrophosphohydrolase